MKYGLDNYLLDPPFSALVAIILLLGLESFGRFSQRFLWEEYYIENRWLRYQNTVFGLLLLSIIIYPIALFGIYLNYVLYSIGTLLIILGLIRFGQKIYLIQFSEFTRILKKTNILEIVILIFLLFYALVALGPVTNADSLHYHIGIAIETLNFGHFPICQEWFHCRLAGSGEVLNALGLAFGSEQFGSLLQFASLVSIYGLVRFYKSPTNDKLGRFFGLVILTSPVLLFLVPSSKPQLYPIGMTSLAFVFILEMEDSRNKKVRDLLFGISISLLMISFTVKFSFILSLLILGGWIFFAHLKNKIITKTIYISATAFLLILFPLFVWKILIYSGSIFEIIFSPLPGVFYGKEKFLGFLRSYSDSSFAWPISLLLPNSLGGISTILGVGILLPIITKKEFILRNQLKYFVIFSFIIIALLFGQSSSRFFLEPFIWLIILTKISIKQEYQLINSNTFLALKMLVFMQAGLVLVSLMVGIYALTPGSFSLSLRERVMSKTANGYHLFSQIKDRLPRDSKVVSSSLATKSLSPYRSVAFDWNSYVSDDESQMRDYLDFMKKENLTHVIFSDGKSNFEGCYGKIVYRGKTHSANRNPFNPNVEYTFFVAELRSELLPDCYDFLSLKK
ncbi:DUF1420 family protein [Leptospira kanakyensis]|uniref:DUF1420 family protein n=1 Tax=Leptospira kanakyensis TaxID=2484968 RepID=UPI00223C9932|nr:DUF1420 family protein [Leptospira kanakyensis]MCW7471380.1 DUF1420 domain-containing protein [Leptospira kanakyensis]